MNIIHVICYACQLEQLTDPSGRKKYHKNVFLITLQSLQEFIPVPTVKHIKVSIFLAAFPNMSHMIFVDICCIVTHQ